MKVLLITPYTVGCFNGKFYHNYLNEHLERYRLFGDITTCCKIKNGIHVGNEINMTGTNIRPLKKVNSPSTLFKFHNDNKKIIKEEVEKADFIIAYIPSYLANYAIGLAKKDKKKVLAVAISCVWDSFWNHSLKGKLLAPFSFLTMRRTMRNADFALYVTSLFLQRRYPSKGLSLGVSDVVLNDFDDELLKQRINRISASDYHKTPFKIITCGAIDVKYKRQEDVIAAIAMLKEYNLHYYMAGGGKQDRLRSIAEKLGVSERIHFMGMLNHDDIFKTLDEMDLYIQPSKQEGLPRALVEAMSRALPAIGSNAGGIPELLQEDYIFRKGNVNQLRQLIIKMLSPHVRKDCSIMNYNKSKEFETNHLYHKRLNFLKRIKAMLD